MPLVFHYLSGSPFSWKVWLALEHKGVPYRLRVLQADLGDLRAPLYLKLNPHGKAPLVEFDGFPLYESGSIIEFLEEQFPGNNLWPSDIQQRVLGRRLAAEVDGYA